MLSEFSSPRSLLLGVDWCEVSTVEEKRMRPAQEWRPSCAEAPAPANFGVEMLTVVTLTSQSLALMVHSNNIAGDPSS